jgi:anti-anti-sigma factor
VARSDRRIELIVDPKVDGLDVVLHVSGELDLATLAGLQTAIDAAAARVPTDGRVVLELAGVRFIDAAGLRLLLDSAQRRQPAVVLRSPSAPVRRLFDVTGLDALISAPAPEGEGSVA